MFNGFSIYHGKERCAKLPNTLQGGMIEQWKYQTYTVGPDVLSWRLEHEDGVKYWIFRSQTIGWHGKAQTF
jgi:hypothetical protein